MTGLEIVACGEVGEFSFRWPDAVEVFEAGWDYEIHVEGETRKVRHGIGSREVYGRLRLHTVTWLDGAPQVEGVEADDYPLSQALLSRLRRAGRATARTWAEIPPGYAQFAIVEHRVEIDAPYSPACLAVKLREDDLAGWALHAWLRSRLPRKAPATEDAPVLAPTPMTTLSMGAPPTADATAIASALLAHGATLAAQLSGGAVFTPNVEANKLVSEDAFAFLVAVIADMGIKAERAWELPYQLRKRVGHLDPEWVAANPGPIRDAVQQSPKLHRFVNLIPEWITRAAQILTNDYKGDAANLWLDEPTAVALRRRLEAFPGIGQKKAAMAVEILARDLKKPIKELTGSDVAYDVQLRRVFLRSGLVDFDDPEGMIRIARALNPERPGALDFPAWDIGRRWCHPREPACPTCPLNAACARLIERGTTATGI